MQLANGAVSRGCGVCPEQQVRGNSSGVASLVAGARTEHCNGRGPAGGKKKQSFTSLPTPPPLSSPHLSSSHSSCWADSSYRGKFLTLKVAAIRVPVNGAHCGEDEYLARCDSTRLDSLKDL